MHIKSIELSNVRALGASSALSLALRPLDGSLAGWHVVVGPNGSGKSTLLKAIALACAGPDVIDRLSGLRSWWLSTGATAGRVEVVLDKGPRDRWLLADGTEVGGGERRAVELAVSLTPQAPAPARLKQSRADRGPWVRADQPRGWFVAAYGPFRRLTGAHLPPVGEEQRPRAEAQLVSLFEDGRGLAHPLSWLKQLKLDESADDAQAPRRLLPRVLELLSDGLMPGQIKALRVNGAGLELRETVLRGDRNAEGITLPLSALSDGYQSTVAMVIDLLRHLHKADGGIEFRREGTHLTVQNEGVVLIDEVEAHLHPAWQRSIGPWFVRHFPNMQFIVTTHSPFVVQSATSGCVVRLARRDEPEASRVFAGDELEAVVAGTADDVYLSSLFGVQATRSEHGLRLMAEATALETQVLEGTASAAQVARYQHLKAIMPASADLLAALRSLEERL